MNKSIWLLIGFLLFFNGMVSLILTLVSVKLVYLTWMDNISPLFGFVVKFMMVLLGVLIIILASTDWDKEKRMLDE
jgi:hypothetical protein